MSALATLELNKAHWPVTVLGPGRRSDFGCRGAGSAAAVACRRTPGLRSSKTIAVHDLLARCKHRRGGGSRRDHDQRRRALPAAGRVAGAARRIARVAAHGKARFRPAVLQRLPLEDVERKHAKLLALLDAVIPEPYVDHLPQGNVWRALRNQPLVPLSERGHARYAGHIDAASRASGKRCRRPSRAAVSG